MIIHKYQFHCHLLPFALNLNVTSKWVELWCCVLRSLLYTAKQRFHVLLKHSLLYCLHRVHAEIEQTVTKRSQHIITWRLRGSTSIWSCIQNIYLTLSNEETQGYEAVTQISVYYIRCVGRLAPAATCSYTLWSHFTLVTLEWWRGRQGSAGALASFRLIFPPVPRPRFVGSHWSTFRYLFPCHSTATARSQYGGRPRGFYRRERRIQKSRWSLWMTGGIRFPLTAVSVILVHWHSLYSPLTA